MTGGRLGDASDRESDSDAGDLVPHRLIDTSNRRSAAFVYLVAAVLAVVLVLATGISLMWVSAVLPLLGLAVYQFMAGRHLEVSDMDAIGKAADAAPFEPGHSSATLGFRGFTARPVWQVLVFEAGTSPGHQALVTVDALTGEVTGTYSESVPAL